MSLTVPFTRLAAVATLALASHWAAAADKIASFLDRRLGRNLPAAA
mgnify:CR=1 FL=1